MVSNRNRLLPDSLAEVFVAPLIAGFPLVDFEPSHRKVFFRRWTVLWGPGGRGPAVKGLKRKKLFFSTRRSMLDYTE